MDHESLARLAGIPCATLRGWVHKGVLRPERPARWNLAEALGVVLFAGLLAENRSNDQAAAEAGAMVQALGDMIAGMQEGHGAAADKVIFVTATFPDGECWHRLVTTADDLERLLAAMLRRQPVRVDLRDRTELYCRTLEAFERTPAREFA